MMDAYNNEKKMKQNVYDYSYQLRRKRAKRISFAVGLLISVFLIISLFLNFVLFPVHVKSDSMESGVVKGSAIFVTPLLRTPRRGDIYYISRLDGLKNSYYEMGVNVIFRFISAQKFYPFGFTSRMSGNPFLRRVLALPGDTIYMKDYILYVKPRGENLFLTEFELAHKPYNLHIYSVPTEWPDIGVSGNISERVLGPGEYFVLADNRVECADSRVWGSIPAERLQGRALFTYFPLNKLRIF